MRGKRWGTLICLINEHAGLTFFTFLKTISLFSRSFFRKFGPYVLACSFIRGCSFIRLVRVFKHGAGSDRLYHKTPD